MLPADSTSDSGATAAPCAREANGKATGKGGKDNHGNAVGNGTFGGAIGDGGGARPGQTPKNFKGYEITMSMSNGQALCETWNRGR